MSEQNESEKTVATVVEQGETDVILILDRSSSMDSIRAEARACFNEQIQKVKEKGKEAVYYLTIVNFATTVDEPVMFRQRVDETLSELGEKDYVPNGMTALCDAIGTTCKRVREAANLSDKKNAVLVLVVTDGHENCSQKFKQADIASLIKELEGTDQWTFTYLGANMDPRAVAQTYGLDMGNIQMFNCDSVGVAYASSTSTKAFDNYHTMRSRGMTKSSSFYSSVQEEPVIESTTDTPAVNTDIKNQETP